MRNDIIKNDQEIADFIAHEQIIRDSLDTLQYKLIFVPEFSTESSLIILKMAHCLCDGVCTMALTSTLTDGGYNQDDFPKLTPRMSLLQWIAFTVLKIIMMPYSIIIAQISIFKPNKRNEIFPTGA